MSTVLIPVDDSVAAASAAQYASEIARSAPGTRLLLLNVQERLERQYKHGLRSQAARDHLRAQGEDAAAQSRAVLERSDCVYEFMIAYGRPADVIARVADEKQCDSIVMGTHWRGSLGRLFLGSVANDVVQQARVPVTLVKAASAA